MSQVEDDIVKDIIKTKNVFNDVQDLVSWMADKPDIVKKLRKEEKLKKLKEKKASTYEGLEMLKTSPEDVPDGASSSSKDAKNEHISRDGGKKQMDAGRDEKRSNGFRFGVKGKVLTLVLVSILLSTSVTGYIGFGTINNVRDVAVSMTKDELISTAESNLMTLAEDKAYEVDRFCSEFASDTAGQASHIYHVFTDDTYSNLVYEGGLYANFGYADWKHGANSSRINGILNGTISDSSYDELLALCDDANSTKLNDALEMLMGGSYAEQPESGMKPSRINVTLWSKLMSVNTLVKAKSKKGICDQFLLYNFMYGLLTKEAQKEIDLSLTAGEAIKGQIDSHEDYDMARISYWGNTTYSTSLLYSKKTVKIPSPFHNIYYCPKNMAIREGEEWKPSWSVIGCTGELSMTCTVPVCKSPLEPISEENVIMGGVTFWTDLTTLSNRIANVTVEKTGYAFIVDGNGKVIAHPDTCMLYKDFTAGETEFNSTVKKMIEGKSGVERITYGNISFYMAYTSVNITGWSVALMVPFEEVVLSATSMSNELEGRINMLGLYLVVSTVLIITAAALAGYIFTKRLTKPITVLADEARAISRGDFSSRIHVIQKDEVGMLAKSFNHMAASLEEHMGKLKSRTAEVEHLLKQKDDFINQLGHDLKNPLGPIINLLPILEKTEKDPKSKEMFEVLNRNVRYIKNLVVKTVELGNLNSPKANLDMEDANLLDEVNDVIKNNELLFEENSIEIDNKISDKTIIKADKMKLTELFDNLISNAVKYSPDGGTITVDVKEDDDFVTVSVKDTGMGMTEEQLSYIFDEFYKADGSRHDFDSSGLGLPICKCIVEKHGGRIWAESEGEGKGTTMLFTLPISSEKQEDKEQ